MSADDARSRADEFIAAVGAMDPTPALTFAATHEIVEGEGGGPVAVTREPVIVLETIVPMTTSVRVATDNFRRHSLVALRGRTGRLLAPFSDRPEEGETVYLPGTVVLTVGVRTVGDLTVTLLEEIELGAKPFPAADDELAALLEEIGRRVSDERSAPERTIPRPDKWLLDTRLLHR